VGADRRVLVDEQRAADGELALGVLDQVDLLAVAVRLLDRLVAQHRVVLLLGADLPYLAELGWWRDSGLGVRQQAVDVHRGALHLTALRTRAVRRSAARLRADRSFPPVLRAA